MTIEEFIQSLDFKENDYFYHVTGQGNAESILEEGLYVDGNNILNTNNILETTTLPLTPDIVASDSQFKKFLIEEQSSLGFRDTSELVILGAPKSCMKQIVSAFYSNKSGVFYEGVVHPDYIMGYFSRDSLEFTLNEKFNYGTDAFYESLESRPF